MKPISSAPKNKTKQNKKWKVVFDDIIVYSGLLRGKQVPLEEKL